MGDGSYTSICITGILLTNGKEITEYRDEALIYD